MTKIVTVTNSGAAPLVNNSTSVSGMRFGKGSDTCANQTLPVNGTCTVSVTFNPNNTNKRSGTLTVNDNGVGGSQQVALSGTGN